MLLFRVRRVTDIYAHHRDALEKIKMTVEARMVKHVRGILKPI